MSDTRDSRPPSRSDAPPDVWARSRFVGLARDVLAHEPFTSLGRAAYRAIARFGARELARMPHVDGVYGVGSMRRPDAFAPGYSDIDLYVLAELGTALRERELRDALSAWLARRAPLRVLKHVDVGCVAELERSRRAGGAWAIDLDRRFRRLAGTDRTTGAPPARPPEEIRLIEVAEAFRRWTKASPNLVDGALRRDPRERARGAMRLLADVLAAGLGADRLDPLAELLVSARATGLVDAGRDLHVLGAAIGLDADRARVELAGDVLDRLVVELASSGPARVLPRDDHAAGETIAHLHRAGVAGTVSVAGHRHGGREPRFAVGRPGESTGAVLRRLVAADARVDGSIPVAASERLIASSFLLDPFPFASGAMVSSGCEVSIATADPASARVLARARLVASPRRARGRMLRLGADPAGARVAACRELAIGHSLAAALERDAPADATLGPAPDARDFDETLVRLESRIDALFARP